MRIAVIVAGLAVSVVAATAASSATRPEAGMGVGTSNKSLGGTPGLVVIAQDQPMYHHPMHHHPMYHHPMYHHSMYHHPMYHHYKHRLRTPK